MRARICFLPLLAGTLAACAAVPQAQRPGSPGTPARPGSRPGATSVPPTQPAPPPVGGFRVPQVMRAPGLEDVIGRNSTALSNQFGPPRLDVIEGDARKLQFSGEACVLDIWLYPLREGAEPTATYVEARRRSDGLDVDRAACVAALKQ